MSKLVSLELCAGAGGQALGVEAAGFELAAAVEWDRDACATLTHNRPEWDVRQADLAEFDAREFDGIDLLAAGVPCPPFSIAGRQLGDADERDLFPAALRIVRETHPRAILFENVRGLAQKRFDGYRRELLSQLAELGYVASWQVLTASNFGLPQLRPRWLLVATREGVGTFDWPSPSEESVTVGEALYESMSSKGWLGSEGWKARAAQIGPTVVGGSKKHGGPDLGPTRARERWLQLGVDGRSIAAEPPGPDFPVDGTPKLTVEMVARLQGFPQEWQFLGSKTARYRQVGNAFPPPVAEAVARQVISALSGDAVTSGQMRLLEQPSDYEAAGG